VTIARTIRLAALIAIISVGVVALGCEVFYLHWLRSVVAAGNRQLLETAPDKLDRDLRAALPAGTARAKVEATLQNRRLQYSYDAAHHVIRATAPDLKGSNPLTETSLRVYFQLEPDGSLKAIHSRVVNSGL
jgi:hypothetical protein